MQESQYQDDTKELWKRVVPALVGLLALLAIPKAAITALLTPMLFDAPTSILKVSRYMIFIVLLAKPVMLLGTVIMSFLVFKSFSRARFVALLIVPALWWTSYWVSIVAAT